LFKIVITGFNTDIEYDGVVYHVQTEDKGLDSPLILSLVYSGGAILASKRSRYEDLIAAGFDEGVLAQRLKRQHRLICAAINAGRLEELKRMGARAEAEVTQDDKAATVAPATDTATQELKKINDAGATQTVSETESLSDDTVEIVPPAPETPVVTDETYGAEKVSERRVGPRSRRRTDVSETESAYTVYDPRRQSPQEVAVKTEMGLVVTVLDDDEFRAGESFVIRVLVEDRSGKKEKPLMGATVSVKIVGTAFRPQIYSVKTERDGMAAVSTTMPTFTSGRAAVLIRVVARDQTAEVRRVIHPAQVR
jgi:hypothetical protein